MAFCVNLDDNIGVCYHIGTAKAIISTECYWISIKPGRPGWRNDFSGHYTVWVNSNLLGLPA